MLGLTKSSLWFCWVYQRCKNHCRNVLSIGGLWGLLVEGVWKPREHLGTNHDYSRRGDFCFMGNIQEKLFFKKKLVSQLFNRRLAQLWPLLAEVHQSMMVQTCVLQAPPIHKTLLWIFIMPPRWMAITLSPAQCQSGLTLSLLILCRLGPRRLQVAHQTVLLFLCNGGYVESKFWLEFWFVCLTLLGKGFYRNLPQRLCISRSVHFFDTSARTADHCMVSRVQHR